MKTLKMLLAIAALLATAMPVQAQDEDTTAKADDVIAKMIEASGGVKAHKAIKNRVALGKMVMAAQGIEAKIKQVEAAPAKSYMLIDLSQMGMTQEKGSDGKIAWEKDSMGGPRLLDGVELKDAIDEGRFNAVLDWKKIYPKRSHDGEAEFHGVKCHKLTVELPSGSKQTWFVDVETNLHVGVERVATSPYGEIKVILHMKDYKKVDGLMIPHRIELNQMGQDIVMEITSVQHNVELDANAFALPDDVKKLVEKQKSKDESEADVEKKTEEAGKKD